MIICIVLLTINKNAKIGELQTPSPSPPPGAAQGGEKIDAEFLLDPHGDNYYSF